MFSVGCSTSSLSQGTARRTLWLSGSQEGQVVAANWPFSMRTDPSA